MTSRIDTKELHFSFIYNAQVHNSLYSIQLAEDPTVSERNAWWSDKQELLIYRRPLADPEFWVWERNT